MLLVLCYTFFWTLESELTKNMTENLCIQVNSSENVGKNSNNNSLHSSNSWDLELADLLYYAKIKSTIRNQDSFKPVWMTLTTALFVFFLCLTVIRLFLLSYRLTHEHFLSPFPEVMKIRSFPYLFNIFINMKQSRSLKTQSTVHPILSPQEVEKSGWTRAAKETL